MAAHGRDARPKDTGRPGRRYVIRGGAVMSTNPNVGNFEVADVLVEGKKFVAVRPDIHAPGAAVIDARGRIMMPGFVGTPHHLFETAQRAFLANGLLVDAGRRAAFGYFEGDDRTEARYPQDAYRIRKLCLSSADQLANMVMGGEISLSSDVETTIAADPFTQTRSAMTRQRMVVNQMVLEQGDFTPSCHWPTPAEGHHRCSPSVTSCGTRPATAPSTCGPTARPALSPPARRPTSLCRTPPC
ncbi:hypothetical protein [Prauserella shujinwangii]|uniref:hypothetical protein n=1 Tax=Prauserella shujinwangii TaxID=1453103 RepID=UPI001FE27425|nr:hypothetical protein [Prauserella shujinwangii]